MTPFQNPLRERWTIYLDQQNKFITVKRKNCIEPTDEIEPLPPEGPKEAQSEYQNFNEPAFALEPQPCPGAESTPYIPPPRNYPPEPPPPVPAI